MVTCDLCGGTEATPLLEAPFAGAPAGRAVIRACSGCGLRYLSPRPRPEDLGTYYPDHYWYYGGRQRNATKQAIWNGLRDVLSRAPGRVPLTLQGPAQVLARLLDGRVFDINVVLQDRPGLRVLDVGCGFGDLSLYLKSRGANVTGTDIDRRACEAAARYGLDVRLGSLPEIGFPEGSFDAVILSHVLEHVPSPRELLSEIRRVLRPGGELHIAVPNGDSAGLRMEREFWGPLMVPEHLYFFDESNLRAYLESADFEVRQIRTGNVWRFRLSSWRAMRIEKGWRRSLAVTSSVCLASVMNPAGRDLIRLVAVAA